MKKTLCKTAAAAAMVLVAVAAQAQANKSEFYGELGLTSVTYKESGYSIKPTMIRAIGGVDVHPNFAVEGMLAIGATNDTVRIQNVNLTGEIDNAYGIFLKPKATLAPNLEVFGRLGYVKTKISASIPGYAISDTGSDTAYGLGVSYKFSESLSLNADYMSYYNKNAVKGTGFTVGLGMRF